MSSWNSKSHSAHQQAHRERKKAGLVVQYQRQATDAPCPACSGTGKEHKMVRTYVYRPDLKGGPKSP